MYGDDRIEQHGYRAEYQTEPSALPAVAGNGHDSSDEHHRPAQSPEELSGMMNWRAIGWLALAVLMPASGGQASNQAVACHEQAQWNQAKEHPFAGLHNRASGLDQADRSRAE